MLTCLHTIVKIGGLEEARRYKNMDHMIVDHDIATVRELMFCTWPQIRMERLFFQLIKKKLTSLDVSPPPSLHYNKTLNPAPFCHPLPLPTKMSERGRIGWRKLWYYNIIYEKQKNHSRKLLIILETILFHCFWGCVYILLKATRNISSLDSLF